MDDDANTALSELGRMYRNVVSRDETLTVGMTDSQTGALVARKLWQRLHAGVFLMGPAPPNFEQKLIAATKAAGAGSFVSHRAAARLHRLDGAEAHSTVEVTVTAGLPEPRATRVHRTRRTDPTDVTTVDRIPVSAINRTLIDYASCVPPVLVERAVECAIRRGKATEGSLLRYVEAAPRATPGKARLRQVILGRPLGRAAASGFEVMLLDIIGQHGIEMPERRVPIANESGTIVAEADLGYPTRWLLLEAHSRKWHSTARQTKRDLARHRELERLGYRVEYFTHAEVVRSPERCADRITTALRTASRRSA
ncbi:MAG TPA: hypothetical protein VNB24_08620 [Acidimicrobiales bacterium]|nr:hypothetical protein [Acidimicrobiales bacterium]